MLSALTGNFFGEEEVADDQKTLSSLPSPSSSSSSLPASSCFDRATLSATKNRRILVVNVIKRRGHSSKNQDAAGTKAAVVVEGMGHIAAELGIGTNSEWESEFLLDLGLDNTGLRREAFEVCVVDATTAQPLASTSVSFLEIMDAQAQVLKTHWRTLEKCPDHVKGPLQATWTSKQKRPSGLSLGTLAEVFDSTANSTAGSRRDETRSSSRKERLGEVEVSFAVIEAASLPRLLSLTTELWSTLKRASKLQEEALVALTGGNSSEDEGGEGLSSIGTPKLLSRMLNLRKSSLEETQRRQDAQQSAHHRRKTDVLTSGGAAFPSIDELEVEVMSDATYSTQIVNLVVLGIDLVLQELTLQEGAAKEAAASHAAAHEIAAKEAAAREAAVEDIEASTRDTRDADNATEVARARCAELEAQVASMAEWRQEQGKALLAAQDTIDLLRRLSESVAADAEERLAVMSAALGEAEAAGRAKRRAELSLERKKLVVLRGEGEAQALRVGNGKLRQKVSELEVATAALLSTSSGDGRKAVEQAEAAAASAAKLEALEVRTKELEESLAAAKKNLAEAVEEAEDLRALGEDKDESLKAVEALAEQLAEEKQDLQNTVAELQLLSNNSAASDAGADISEPASVSVLEKDLAECRGVRLELEGRIVELEEEMARQKSKFDAAKTDAAATPPEDGKYSDGGASAEHQKSNLDEAQARLVESEQQVVLSAEEMASLREEIRSLGTSQATPSTVEEKEGDFLQSKRSEEHQKEIGRLKEYMAELEEQLVEKKSGATTPEGGSGGNLDEETLRRELATSRQDVAASEARATDLEEKLAEAKLATAVAISGACNAGEKVSTAEEGGQAVGEASVELREAHDVIAKLQGRVGELERTGKEGGGSSAGVSRVGAAGADNVADGMEEEEINSPLQATVDELTQKNAKLERKLAKAEATATKTQKATEDAIAEVMPRLAIIPKLAEAKEEALRLVEELKTQNGDLKKQLSSLESPRENSAGL